MAFYGRLNTYLLSTSGHKPQCADDCNDPEGPKDESSHEDDECAEPCETMTTLARVGSTLCYEHPIVDGRKDEW
jgi:hypothetical protein